MSDENAPPAVNGRAEGQTILVVDDEAVILHLMEQSLHDTGYVVITAADAKDGLKILQSDTQIALLITDVGLPGMNGRQLADAARHARPDLKVLFVTGYAERAVIGDRPLEPGMALLNKPFTLNALERKVSELTGAL
jgi:CheY-like chemotaxis protein